MSDMPMEERIERLQRWVDASTPKTICEIDNALVAELLNRGEDYTDREERLMRERDKALTRAELTEEAVTTFQNIIDLYELAHVSADKLCDCRPCTRVREFKTKNKRFQQRGDDHGDGS